MMRLIDVFVYISMYVCMHASMDADHISTSCCPFHLQTSWCWPFWW